MVGTRDINTRLDIAHDEVLRKFSSINQVISRVLEHMLGQQLSLIQNL
ncbi:non-functional NADPH-dependent codeinone reductase 2-like [Iris pallida]|uniref:Non-functional NADPH-dependent codeinone reductase 2-like n=1 Tax=Iris pallida TaxID=29817 RepID=A0AAX6IAQ4_IRIPA|nr:non-functional NADPH-dependent codeinone reductase 2-like [Iris pallida]